MRLIDADALKAKAHADTDSGEGFVWVQDIDEAPTVDAVPVVHGRWEAEVDEDEDWGEMEYHKCSVCGKFRFWETNYCPSCGATMDLEVDND